MLAWGPAAALAEPLIDHLGIHVWRSADANLGGISGFELSEDGRRYWALSDRASIRWGSVERNSQGRITRLTTAGTARIKDSDGVPLTPGYIGDSEGLAVDDQGRIFIAFEGLNRVARYDTADSAAEVLPKAPEFQSLSLNAGLEALAIAPNGDLYTMPEVWAAGEDFPIWRLRDGAWTTPYRLPRTGRWAPVGADIGPDGKLYVLERDFQGVLGFVSRVTRYELGDTLGAPELLLESVPLQYDNLEGIAVWADAQGIRVTLISDDNFLFFQRTELVEFRVREPRSLVSPPSQSALSEPSALTSRTN